MKTKFKFKFSRGDWSEIADILTGKECKTDEAAAKVISKMIREALGATCGDQCHPISIGVRRNIACFRQFSQYMGQRRIGRHCSPMWRGLSEIKDDYSFLQMFREVYKCMW